MTTTATEIEENWMTPIYEYLISSILLEDPKEARKVRIKAPQYRLKALSNRYMKDPTDLMRSPAQCPLIWPTVEENGETRKKKYEELSASEKLQADCDLKATNIVL
ncbi:hypothetical protein Tco_1000782 [Tanacetum coccineum]